jgi:PKD repeat protein
MRFLATVFFMLGFVCLASAQNLVTYAGNSGDERFYSVVQLSDSSYLVAGTADNLNWLPSGTSSVSMSGTGGINNGLKPFKKIGFLLHLKPNLKTILDVLYLPLGTAQDIRRIKLSNGPGSPTGNIFISGTTIDTRGNAGGYFLAKLNNNYISGAPTGLSWAYNVYAAGYHSTEQPWDVGTDGKIVFVAGQPYGTDSCAVLKLKADGRGPDIVDQWRTHYGIDINTGLNTSGEWSPAKSNPNVSVNFSALLMKVVSTCEMRSWNKPDYKSILNDENGKTKQGTWPMDMFYTSACDISLPNKTIVGPGYTGYSISSLSNTLRVGAIVVDRRDNSFYVGASAQCNLTNGAPDEEPFVMAFSKDGTLRWWDRLHQESPSNSTPIQEISGMAIDYSQVGTMGAVVVVASVGGNGVNNLWPGNTVKNNPLNPGFSFDNKYTGVDTTVTVAWLGRLRINNGDLLHSTYITGYLATDPLSQAKYTEPIHDNWASHNAGNPALDETDAEIDVNTDDFGRIYVLIFSHRFVTTKNAYQKMVKPTLVPPASAYFVRVYEPDLTKLAYSSALTGVWSTSTGSGGGNTSLKGVFPVYNGVIVVGYHHDDNQDKTSDGNKIPLLNVPAWGNSLPKAEEAVLARLTYDSLKAYFKVKPKTGACTNTNVVFTDSSVGATSWKWYFGTGATPDTISGKGPHTVKYSTPDTVQVKLVVSNGSLSDSMTIPYIISAAPSSAFTFTGSVTTVPDTLSFTGPVGSGITYSWDFGDTASGGGNYSTLANPTHSYSYPGTYKVILTVTKGNCATTTTKTITITGGIGPPNASFAVSSMSSCLNVPEVFTQTDPTNSTSWYWVFGTDAVPQTSTTPGPHIVHYTSPGAKTAILTVGNGVVKKTQFVNFTISGLPTSGFSYSGATNTIPATLIFTGVTCAGCSYKWNFGDTAAVDNISIKSETTHTYNSDGTYFVTLKVTDGTGCSTTILQTIIISSNNSSYYSDFTVSPTRGTCVGNKVLFTDMSFMPDKSRAWYFGKDAVPAFAFNTDTITVKWNSAGTKTIVLQAGTASGFGTEHVKTISYSVTDYPDASFTFSGNTASAPATLNFSANEADGYMYSWDFGDSLSSNNAANSSSPSHKYTSTGVYPVTLAIIHNGCISYYTRNVYIGFPEPPIVPAFSVQPSKNGCQSPTVTVTDLSIGAVTSYAWQFGSGASPATASTKGPHAVTYSSNGYKLLKITVGNGSITQSARMKIKLKF